MSDSRHQNAVQIVLTLRAAGHEAYLVGGCVRDMVMGLDPEDHDVVTSAPPEQIERLFAHTEAVGKAFGVVLVVRDGCSFEVATFRRDGEYVDGRHPVNVRFGTAREDVERRDFTINGMLYDPVEDRVLDWVEGQEDIRRRRIRTIGDPAKRFQEDRLRVLRAVRFAARLGYAIEEGTYDALCLMSAGLTQISAERIGEEMAKVLCSANAGRAVRLMNDTGILRAILPEVEALVGVEQPPDFHPEGDVFEHTCLMLDAMRSPSPELALAVLLHDVGKPETFVVDDRIRFNDHDKVGAVKAAEICRRFRYSNERVERVEALVEAHMRFAMVMRMKTSTLKRLLAMPHFEEHLELHRLDCLASHRKLDNYDFLVQKMREMPAEVISPPPLITGADLIAMGYLPGPRFREMLGAVRDGQLEGDLSSREQAMEMVRRSFPLDRG